MAAYEALYARLFPAFARPFAGHAEWDAAIRQVDRRGITPEADAAVREFCEAWSLPRETEQEVWGNFYVANYGEPLRLRALWAGHLRPPVPLDLDPLFESPAQGRIRREERRRRTLEAGWEEVPPWYRDRAQLRRLAWRLYQRAVKGIPWSEIKRLEEAQPGNAYVTSTAIRTSVVEWAKALGITLPNLKLGRPPKN